MTASQSAEEMKFNPAGSGSEMTTSVASDGPTFSTTIV